MKESIGSTFLYNIIFLFIIIIFGFLTATLNYYKAFKVNKAILGYISQYSGYNKLSRKAIDNYLGSIGYTPNSEGATCNPERANADLVNSSNSYLYCVYYHGDDTGKNEVGMKSADNKPIYYAYGVTTYLYAQFPIVGKFKVPVYTKGERIYKFSDEQDQGSGL